MGGDRIYRLSELPSVVVSIPPTPLFYYSIYLSLKNYYEKSYKINRK